MKQGLFIAVFIVLGMAVLLRVMVYLFFPGATVTSWVRSLTKNTAVGGARRSAHLLGWGIDMVPVRQDYVETARSLFPFVLNEGDHIHIGWY